MVSSGVKYAASKLLAHRATLDWVATHDPHFNVITLHPSYVLGHSLIQTSAENVDILNGFMWGHLFTEDKISYPSSSVDVEDVAAAHLKALDMKVGKKTEVQEFLLDGGWSWERLLKIVNEKYPNAGFKRTEVDEAPWTIETKRAEEILGMKWRSLEDTVSAFVDQQLQFAAKS